VRLFLFALADRLKMRVSDIEQWPEAEILEWHIFFEIQAEQSR